MKQRVKHNLKRCLDHGRQFQSTQHLKTAISQKENEEIAFAPSLQQINMEKEEILEESNTQEKR